MTTTDVYAAAAAKLRLPTTTSRQAIVDELDRRLGVTLRAEAERLVAAAAADGRLVDTAANRKLWVDDLAARGKPAQAELAALTPVLRAPTADPGIDAVRRSFGLKMRGGAR